VKFLQQRLSILNVFEFVTCLVLIPSVLALGERLSWFLELLAHFRLQYVIAALCLLIIFLGRRSWHWAAIAFVLLVTNGWFIGYALHQAKPQNDYLKGSAPFGLVLFNMNVANNRLEDLAQELVDNGPSLVVLQEYTHRADKVLSKALAERYPYQIAIPANHAFGMAAFSAVPLTVISTAPLADERITTLRFKLENRNLGEITVTAMHPVPPVTPTSAKARNNEIKAVSEWIAKQDGKQILLGDLNLTPYSYVFRDLIETSGLRPVRPLFYNTIKTTTWPSFTLSGFFRIPIDHVLLSDDLQFTTSGWQKEFGHGSDHALLRIELEPGPHASLF